MTEIRILHLSDLHAGMTEHRERFQHLRASILQDLHDHVGSSPVHLLLFTGDLTQRGAEFDSFRGELTTFVEALRKWTGRIPVVLAVPGNHDLQRPDANDGVLTSLLGAWDSNETLRSRFWSDEKHDMRKIIDSAFANYRTWWSAHCNSLDSSTRVRHGLLPGDFSASIVVDDLRVGVVGLNSAFLQLAENCEAGDLDIDLVQLNRAVPGEVDPWLSSHGLTLLLTHHPPSWLCERGQETFHGWIARADRFDAHLFGHMHTPETRLFDALGVKRPAAIQAPSLFGVEKLRDGSIDRAIGYSLLRFDVSTRIWRLTPRAATKIGRDLRVNPDTRFALQQSRWVEFSSSRSQSLSAVSSSAEERPGTTSPDLEVDPPGGGYVAAQYVERSPIEDDAMDLLRRPGRPVALYGEPGTGKTWMLSHLARRWRNADKTRRAVTMSLRSLGSEALRDMDRLVFRLAAATAAQLGLPDSSVAKLDPRQYHLLSPMWRLWGFFVDHVLVDDRFVLLALDDADQIRDHDVRMDLYGGLRAWMDEDLGSPMQKLRLLLAVSTPTASLIEGDGTRSLWSLTMPFALRPFSEPELSRFISARSVSSSPATVAYLQRESHGVPGLAARALWSRSRASGHG